MPSPIPGHIESALSPERVFLTRASSKEDLLNTLIDHLNGCKEVEDIEALRNAIFSREELMSTGIGLGVGVPHARIPSIRRMILAAAVNETPLTDYESIDGQPIQIVFLVAGRPDQQAGYVRLLAELSRCVKEPDQRKALLQADSEQAVYEQLTQQQT